MSVLKNALLIKQMRIIVQSKFFWFDSKLHYNPTSEVPVVRSSHSEEQDYSKSRTVFNFRNMQW